MLSGEGGRGKSVIDGGCDTEMRHSCKTVTNIHMLVLLL